MMSLTELSQTAARRFLQSAVFIDDKIYDRPTGRPLVPDQEEGLPRARKSVFAGGDQAGAPAGPAVVVEQPPFHPRDLVGSFAKEGIVCALYEPVEGFATDAASEIFKLCETADLVILDWDFFNDDGAKMKALVVSLVKQSRETVPHHIRLVVVYTTDKSLLKVANALYEAIRAEITDVSPLEAPKLGLVTGSTRIVVFGKDGVDRIEGERPFTTKEADLATRVIQEFAAMNVGLLPSWALMGMAAVRHNAKRILDRFRGDMDGAFLLHRALVMNSEEAFDQLPRLLAEEFLAVVEDDRTLDDEAKTSVAKAAIAELIIRQPDPAWRDSKKGDAIDSAPILRSLLERGKDGLGDHQSCLEAKKLFDKFRRIPPDIMQGLSRMVDPGNSDSNRRLAELFSVQTSYSDAERALSFGTVVREAAAEGTPASYSICLMPICDGIRLTDTPNGTSFPFWVLGSNVSSGNSQGRAFVVHVAEEFVELIASGKPRDRLWIERFAVDPKTGTVNATVENESLLFVGKKKRLAWVAQLKPLHAQRIANDVGQALSRVGLTEAEWVRLLCER